MSKILALTCRIVAAAAVLFISGCGSAPLKSQEPSPSGVPRLSAAERADLKRLAAGAAAGQPTPLDFSDPVHFRFLKKQLELAGITPEDSPQLYRVLESSRQEHQRSGPPRLDRPGRKTAARETPEPAIPLIQPIQTFTSLGSENGTDFTSSALSSVPNQPFVSILVLGLFDRDLNLIGKPVAKAQYVQGENLLVNAAGTLTAGKVVIAIAAYLWVDRSGILHSGYLQAKTTAAPESGARAQTTTTPTITNTAPKPKETQTVIKLCLGRSGEDCTYAPSGGSGSNVLLPVAGSVTFDGDIVRSPIIPDTSAISITRPDAGQCGGCPLYSMSEFFNDPNTVINGDTITWDLPEARFGAINGCLEPNSEAFYTFELILTVTGPPNEPNQVRFITITNVRDTTTNAPACSAEDTSCLQIAPLVVFFSCLAEGTEVLMAGGEARKIEDIRPADRVVTHAGGTTMAVDSKLKGTEEVPMVRLRTARGHDLLLTDGHPVVTPDGVKLARMLHVGDLVTTSDGPSELVFVGRERFDGHVWNLNVGPRQEDFEHLADNTTFFANGILVGDNQMQFHYNRKYMHEPISVLEILPPEWHEDYWHDRQKQKGAGKETPVDR